MWGGAVPSPFGGLGAYPQKKNQFCTKNYAILSKFWYFFPILQQKVGGLSPSPKSGGTYPSPCPPCCDAYGYSAHTDERATQQANGERQFWKCQNSVAPEFSKIRLGGELVGNIVK